MYPSKGTAIPRGDLGQVVYATMTDAPLSGFIADRMMPIFFVGKQSGDYPVLPAEALFNNHKTVRAPGAGYQRVSEIFEYGFYRTTENGLEMPLDERSAAIYGSLFDYESTISNLLMAKILRAREVRVAAKLINENNFPAVAASAAWDAADPNPRADVDAGKAALRKKGIVPNLLAVSYATFLNLTKVPRIVDAVKNIFPDVAKTGSVQIQHLEAYLDIPLAVAGGMVNQAKLGKNADLADIWPDTHAMLCRVAAPGSDVTEPSVGRTFLWNEGATEEVMVEEYEEEQTRSRILRVRHDSDEALLASIDDDTKAVRTAVSRNCGYLIKSIKTVQGG